jgi:hypothetical protein
LFPSERNCKSSGSAYDGRIKSRKNEIPISVRKMYKMVKRTWGVLRIRIKSKEDMHFLKNHISRSRKTHNISILAA